MKNKGISLIVLVITIVIMIILATTIILSLNGSGIISSANEAKFKNDLSVLKERMAMAKTDVLLGETVDYSDFVPDGLEKYIMMSANNEPIYYADPTLEQATWAREADIKIIDQNLYTVIENTEELIDLAEDFLEVYYQYYTKPNVLALQYIRNTRSNYTKGQWTNFAGDINEDFLNWVEENKSKELTFPSITDPVTGETIDFVHCMASLNVYAIQDTTMMYEYTCWAGDLATLAKQVNKYASAGSYSLEQLKTYTNTLLGTKTSGSEFGLADMLADVDAVNLSNLLTGRDDLADVIFNYYIGDNVDICINRYTHFNNYLTNTLYADDGVIKLTPNDKLYDIAMSYMGAHEGATLGKSLTRLLLGSTTYNAITANVWQAVSTCFSQYINKNM